MKLINDERADLSILLLILFLMAMVVVAISADALLMSKISPKFNGSDATSNATMDKVKERSWNSIDLGAIAFPISFALGFVVFIILWQRQTPGGQV